MKVLSIAPIVPPRKAGGIEISMLSLAAGLAARGHENTLLGAAFSEAEEGETPWDHGLILRRHFPRPYTLFETGSAVQKSRWHWADHVHPENERKMRGVLDAVRPDVIIVHSLQGIGHNAVKAIAERDIPVMYYLHDFGLVCVNRAFFRGGKRCEGWCAPCRLSSRVQGGFIRRLRRVGFAAPSQAILDVIGRRFDFGDRPTRKLINANRFPEPKTQWREDTRLRLLYVGRVEPAKGVNFICGVVERLNAVADRCRLSIVGGGSQLDEVKARWGAAPWLSLEGSKSRDEVIDLMATHDLLVVPSLWPENSPGVVFEAIWCGLPVVASRIGGLPEFVEDGRTGLLPTPGDPAAWHEALDSILRGRPGLKELRDNAARDRRRYDPDEALARIEVFLLEIVSPGRR